MAVKHQLARIFVSRLVNQVSPYQDAGVDKDDHLLAAAIVLECLTDHLARSPGGGNDLGSSFSARDASGADCHQTQALGPGPDNLARRSRLVHIGHCLFQHAHHQPIDGHSLRLGPLPEPLVQIVVKSGDELRHSPYAIR